MTDTQPESTAISYETVMQVQRETTASLQWEVTMLKARNIELEREVSALRLENQQLAQAETDRLEAAEKVADLPTLQG